MNFVSWILWRIQLFLWALEEDVSIYSSIVFWAALFFVLLAAINFAETRKELS